MGGSKDKLVVNERDYDYVVQWALNGDEMDIGATLGEGQDWEKWAPWSDKDMRMMDGALQNTNPEWSPDDVDHWLATRAIANMTPRPNQNYYGFTWETIAAAKKAMAVAKVAIKLYHDNAENWPEWAKTALANGWVAPKGWKP